MTNGAQYTEDGLLSKYCFPKNLCLQKIGICEHECAKVEILSYKCVTCTMLTVNLKAEIYHLKTDIAIHRVFNMPRQINNKHKKCLAFDLTERLTAGTKWQILFLTDMLFWYDQMLIGSNELV